MSLTYGKTPEETLEERAIDLQDMIDFIEDMRAECSTSSTIKALIALDGELELCNVEVTNE